MQRPSWNYIRNTSKPSEGANQQDVLEMTESVRNTLEGIQKSQMLQCDVAYAIKGMFEELKAMRADLKKFLEATAPKKTPRVRKRPS